MTRKRVVSVSILVGVIAVGCLGVAGMVGRLSGPGDGSSRVDGGSTAVAFIGDSLTEKTVPYLPSALAGSGFVGEVYYGVSGYSMTSFLNDYETVLPPLPDTVVLALGTVDMRHSSPADQRELLDRVLTMLGPDRRVIWVDVYRDDHAANPEIPEPGTTMLNDVPGVAPAFNALLRDAQQQHPNLEIANWAEFVELGNAFVNDDGIHYHADSYPARAAFMVEALAAQR